MIKRLWTYGVLALVLIAGLFLLECNPTAPEPKIPPVVQADIDSLRITRPMHDAARDSALARARQDSIIRVDAQRRAARAEASAMAARRLADSLAAAAQSAEEWKAAHDQREAEARRWEQTANEKEKALQAEVASHAETSIALGLELGRRLHLETVTVPNLQLTIAELEKPCKVIGPIPCPSRKVVAVVSAGLGAYAGYKLATRP